MKLLYCRACDDIILLNSERIKYCSCGLSGGVYETYNDAVYMGVGIPVGIDNGTFFKAIENQNEDKPTFFKAFVFEKCDHFKAGINFKDILKKFTAPKTPEYYNKKLVEIKKYYEENNRLNNKRIEYIKQEIEKQGVKLDFSFLNKI